MTKTPRRSSTSSWTIFVCSSVGLIVRVAIRSFRVWGRYPGDLLGVKLDDQRLLDRSVDLFPLGPLQNLAGEPVVVGLEPGRHGCGEVGCVADDGLGRAARRHRDHVLGLDLVARDVHAAAVDVEVAVPDELARLRARGGEAEPVDDVVEARLQHPQQLLARDSRSLRRLAVVGAELLLEQAVVAPRLLLLAQLQQILGLLDPAAAVLAGRIAAALDRALLRQAALSLEEQLHALATALLALGGTVAGHQTRRLFLGRTPLWACGVTSFTPRISRPAACRDRIAVSRPEPGPLTKTSTFCRPCSMPLRAHESAVTWAAKGVDLREPLNPADPADSQTITFPSESVSVTIVLLNDVLMCAWPMAMFLRTRRLVRPRPAWRRGGAITFWWVPSCRGRRSSSGPCGSARSSSSAGRSPAGRDDA